MLVGVHGDHALFDADGQGVLLNVRTLSARACDLENAAAARFWLAAPLIASLSAWSEIATYAFDPVPQTDVQVIEASGNEARMHTIPKAVKLEAALGLARAERLGGQTAMSLYTGRLLASGGQLTYQKLQHVARFLHDNPLVARTSRDPYEKTTWSLWGGNAGSRWVTTMQRKTTLSLVSDGYMIEPTDLEAFDDDSETIIFALTQLGDPFAVEALIKLGIDEAQGISTTGIWDAGQWVPFADEGQLDEWAPRLVEVDGETAMNIAASLDEQPGELVHLAVLNPHETALALMEGFIAAGTDPKEYTPEERAKNAAEQPRDANGRFATVGARGAMKSGTPGKITGINPMNNYLLIEADDGKVYSIPSRDFEIQNESLEGRPPVQDPGQPLQPALPGQPQPPAPPRLDLSKILAQPRALPNSSKAVLDHALPPMNPAALRQVIEDYNAFIRNERQRNARKFSTTFADIDNTQALTPETSDVKPIYLAIVDRDDPTAVLDLVAMAPAATDSDQATTFRRVAGQWIQDAKVLQDLKSPTPPPVVMLNDTDYQSVLQQVDASDPNEPTANEEQQQPVTAAAQYFLGANHQVWSFIAAGDPSGVGSAERLREYWTTGKGGLKIRWRTPGDWTRCHRHLRKYLGERSKGYCANLHHRVNGFWPGDKRNR